MFQNYLIKNFMKKLFDNLSAECSKKITQRYSTSFSLGIRLLNKKLHAPIYGIYGFVRLADEIVDSFHEFDKKSLLMKFKDDTYEAIESRISLNPILNSFQQVVNDYGVEKELIETFFESMEMDLNKTFYDQKLYEKYILGSAETVGLMCLKVFCHEKPELYPSLKYHAMKLGSALQKVNFLRDLKADRKELGRTYFPGVNFDTFEESNKQQIQQEIEGELNEALIGIRKLPPSSRSGVYLAYYYYTALFNKIKSVPAKRIMEERIRVSNPHKFGLMINSLIKNKLNLI
jgi:phytoene/squalene synthetase